MFQRISSGVIPKDGYPPCLLKEERSPKWVRLAAQQDTGPSVYTSLLLGPAHTTMPEGLGGFIFPF